MNRVVTRLGFTTLALVAGVTAHAQSSTTGVVSGVVKDKSGAPVAGATITASSAQTTRVTTTAADGSYRMGLMNAGEWTLKVTKAGLQTLSQKLTVFPNQTTPTNFSVDKEAAAVVEVVASTPTLDFNSNTTGLSKTLDSLAAVPKARDINSIALLSPGVTTSGFGNNPSISGSSGAENSYILDGLSTTDYRTGFQGATIPTDFVEQVDVQTGGFKPEYSALGGVFNVVTKSGTNEFRGSVWGNVDARGLEAQGKGSEFGDFTRPQTLSRYDVGVELGGPLVKDKLFYWVGLNSTSTEGEETANVIGSPTGGILTNSAQKTDDLQFVGKLQYFLTQDQQLNFTLNTIDNKIKRDRAYPTRGNADQGFEQKNTSLTASLGYDWTITPSLFLSTKVGFTKLSREDDPNNASAYLVTDFHYFQPAGGGIAAGPGAAFGQANTNFQGQSFLSGGIGGYRVEDTNKTTQIRADLSWFLGNHNLKFGISQIDSKYKLNLQTSGGASLTVSTSGATLSYIQNRTNAEVQSIFRAFYAQDVWEALPGFRLAYGFRFETQELKDFRGRTFLKFDDVNDYTQPRLGISWDVNNDGKTKVSANYAKYYETIPQRVSIRVFANEVLQRNIYRNSTGKFFYDGNNANHYGTVVGGLTDANADRIDDFATPFSFDPVAEGTKLPERSEYILGVDHNFANGFTVGIHARHRELKNPIEDSVITDFDGAYYDPGASSGGLGFFGQAILWNPGRSAAWTARDISGTPNARYDINPGNTPGGTLYDEARNTYDAIDLTIDKKADRDFLSFSYTWSRLQGNYEGLVSSSNGQADANITASFDYYPYVGFGLLPLDRTHLFKLFGSHRFSIGQNDLNIGVNWLYQSGTPISRLDDGSTTIVTLSDGTQGPQPDIGGYGNAIFQDFRQGQFGRTPATNTVDFHADFAWKFTNKYRLTPSVDIFNFFNAREVTGVYQQATDQNANPLVRYGRPNGFQRGRQFRFGLKFQF